MSQRQTKQAKREIRIFCEEQLRRTVNHEQPMDPRVLGNYPARMVRKTVSKFMIDNDCERIMRELEGK
jgi:hypothetical protein